MDTWVMVKYGNQNVGLICNGKHILNQFGEMVRTCKMSGKNMLINLYKWFGEIYMQDGNLW